MKNKFLNISIGLGILFLTGGFFIRSIVPANAAPSPEKFIEEGTGKIGKYMMIEHTFVRLGYDKEGMVIWDTETGRSVTWFYESSTNTWTKREDQLPADPMAK